MRARAVTPAERPERRGYFASATLDAPVSSKQERILAIVATDRTFERHLRGDAPVWVGKCIFCNGKLMIAADGTPISRATIEHIWPRVHGGDNTLVNLALACARCNREKGGRHDSGHKDDARFLEIVEALRVRRRTRWREPDEDMARVTEVETEEGKDEDDDEAGAGGRATRTARRQLTRRSRR
jgi:hypothetical protein